MQITVASKAGACYGVNRALDLALEGVAAPQPVHTLGPLIHNPIVVAQLAAQGISEAKSLDAAGSGSIVIRSHGAAPQVIEEARSRGFHVIDATCPFVSKVQRNAKMLGEEGFGVVIIGEAGHAEVEGIRAWGGKHVVTVVDNASDLPDDLPQKVGVVVQTTQSEELYNSVLDELETRGVEVKAMKTICNATRERQQAARQLAQESDCMVVIGGRNSGNTRRLVDICSASCMTYHIESASELKASWFDGVQRVGVTAGASTPQSHIDEVVAALRGLA